MQILKKAVAFILSGAMVLALFTGCGQSGGDVVSGALDTDYPVTVRDVTLKGEPAGVAVLSPEIGDAILAMGYELTLKAKTEDCIQSDLAILPNVSASDPSGIAGAGAEVALTCETLSEEEKNSFQSAGVTVICIPKAESREDLERFYGEIGAVFRGGNTGYTHGQEIAEDIFCTIDDIARVIPQDAAQITACYLFDTEGGAVTGDQLASKLIEAAGLVNGVSSSTGGIVDMETLKIANPSYIFCPSGLKAQLSSAEGYRDLDAVKNGSVYEMDPSYMTSQGRNMIQAVIEMAGTVYPELAGEESSEPEEETSSEGSESSNSSETTSSSSSSSSGSSGTSSLSGRVLQKGDQGDDVKALQERLDELGYMYLPCTGEFGDGTEQAVKDFQLLNGYAATGIADETMQEALFSSNVRTGPYYGQ